jgi:hypothetical protein
MKKFLFVFLGFICFNSNAQERIAVATNASETFIETYIKSYSNIDAYIKSYSNEFTLAEAYRLGPTSTKTLKNGIRTAIKWIDLNIEYQKDFEKEICRFKAMEKELYKFHGYVDEFTVEMTLNFKGYSDGTFKLEIKQYDSYSAFIEFRDKDMVISFRDLLDGKSANKEIDDIFKK